MNALEQLAAIKRAHSASANNPDAMPREHETDEAKCDADAEYVRQLITHRVPMEKKVTQKEQENANRYCGNCIRWLTCTTMHRSRRVSPRLRACSAWELHDNGIDLTQG